MIRCSRSVDGPILSGEYQGVLRPIRKLKAHSTDSSPDGQINLDGMWRATDKPGMNRGQRGRHSFVNRQS
jgi:hypothetical protein